MNAQATLPGVLPAPNLVFNAEEWKIVALRECPLPEDLRAVETPDHAAQYWRLHITQHPAFNPEVERLDNFAESAKTNTTAGPPQRPGNTERERTDVRSSDYEEDSGLPNTVTVSGYRGIAFYCLGWEVEPDEDTDWTGIYRRTGKVVAVMVGDDRRHIVDFEDITPLAREAYCGVCGQIGCSHDGLDRQEEVGSGVNTTRVVKLTVKVTHRSVPRGTFTTYEPTPMKTHG